MAKLPSIQFYPADWRKDPGVQALGYFERGVWFELLCLMHETEPRGLLTLNGKAMPEEAVSQALGLPQAKVRATIEKIVDYGVASVDETTGALMCRRMVRDERIRTVRTEAGKKGGNPVLVKQKPSKLEAKQPKPDKQNTTPSSSSSTSDKPPIPPLLEFGEFGWCRLTPEQHKKLTQRLNGNFASYANRFDRWVNEFPDAKANGVKRRDRHAYESILNWFDRDVKEGKVGKQFISKDSDIVT